MSRLTEPSTSVNAVAIRRSFRDVSISSWIFRLKLRVLWWMRTGNWHWSSGKDLMNAIWITCGHFSLLSQFGTQCVLNIGSIWNSVELQYFQTNHRNCIDSGLVNCSDLFLLFFLDEKEPKLSAGAIVATNEEICVRRKTLSQGWISSSTISNRRSFKNGTKRSPSGKTRLRLQLHRARQDWENSVGKLVLRKHLN